MGISILALDCVSGQYGGLGMITRPIETPILARDAFHIGLVIIPRPPYWHETHSILAWLSSRDPHIGNAYVLICNHWEQLVQLA
jgi:hypothetical protein